MPAFPEEFLLATSNEGKAKELRAMLAERGIEAIIRTYADYDLYAPEETGTTFLENATIKALAGFEATGLPCLADDSGLCVAALDGAPGVYSADWAERDEGPRDFDFAMTRIEQELNGNPDRRAAFVSTLVFAFSEDELIDAEGRVEGVLEMDAEGDNGFGYDPWFVPQGYDQSFGVLSAEIKNKLSHRRNALDALLEKMRP